MPGQMVLACRREWEAMTQIARDSTVEIPQRVAAVGAAVKVRDQLLDLLSLPKRPPGGGKAGRLLDVSGSGLPDISDLPELPPQNPGIPS